MRARSNYWVNMVQCINGLADITYDLGNSSHWEYIFPHLGAKPMTSIQKQDLVSTAHVAAFRDLNA